MDNKFTDSVNVSLRIRPVLSEDSSTSCCLQVISKQPPVLLVLDRSQTYHFDKIFTEEVGQQTVYYETVRPLVDYVKKGYNSTVLAYGQTGTGKTYTMGTCSQVSSEESAGLIPRTLDQFFDYNVEDGNVEVDISVSFIEIYNEKVFDLLQDSHKPPLIVKGVKLQGLKQEKVFNCDEAKKLLHIGNKNRHTAETKQNSNSSRSHAIFTIYCSVKHKNRETHAKLNLVDLAGSESVRKTGNQGSTFQEGVNINKGLLCLGQVMTALSTNSNFIPYRQSLITIILQDSLSTKNFISLIVCINSNPEDCNETIQTLEFAQRVKKMKSKPEVSEAIMLYKRDNPTLFQTLKVSNTPFKRPASVLQTPCNVKRMRNMPIKEINEPSGNNTTADSPKSLYSMSMASVSNNIDVTHQNLSPVIRKYVTAMESSLMSKLETVIKTTLNRPTRSSLVMKEKYEDKENTPKMSWNKIQSEVSKLVRHEIVQLTAKANRAASSPLDEYVDINKIKKILKYDSPILNVNSINEVSQNDVSLIKQNSIDNELKVPELPIPRLKNQKKRTASISPIQFVPVHTRQSLNLSLKKKHDSNSLEESDISLEVSYIQTENHQQYMRTTRSIRLAEKKCELQDRTYEKCVQKKNTQDQQNSINDENEKSKFQYNRRCSVRLIEKRNKKQKLVSEKNKLNKNNDSSLEFSINYDQRKNNLLSDTKIHTSNRCNGCRGDTNKHNRKYSKRLVNHDNCNDRLCTACIEKSLVQTPKANKTVGNKNKKTKISTKGSRAQKQKVEDGSRCKSPATFHTKYVLNVLNNGNIKELEQLHSIGPKTAQQVLLYREIKGRINKISDLLEMPGWHGRKFEKFVALNFLKKELL